MVRKMAASAKEIHDFLHDLLSRARPIAQRELAELREFAHDEYGLTEIKPWDLRYLGERLRESRYTTFRTRCFVRTSSWTMSLLGCSR